MSYGRMPLHPGDGCDRSSLRMPLFDHCRPQPCGEYRPMVPEECCQCVRLQNPACPGEFADVELCVDCNGNLSICVKRPPKPCGCNPCTVRRRPRCNGYCR